MLYRVENISSNKFSSELYEKAYSCMPPERKAKTRRLVKEEDKRLCVFSHWLLSEMLREQNIYNPEFCTDSKGKPYIKGNPVYFNLSHSGDFVACALSAKPVGIDIEVFRNSINTSLVNRICTENEIKYILSEDKINIIRFFSVWTAKEAYLKCTGEGLSAGLKEITVADKNNLKEMLSPNHKLTHTLSDSYALSIVKEI